MGENNKILDVTYGHFSCRLEGFEDSVETMKLVVGYFHDLAGSKLFTDEEFVVPDIETLTRLAAEQSGSKVAIDAEKNHVSLRVLDEEEDEPASEDADQVDDLLPEQSFDTAEAIEEPAEAFVAVEDEDLQDSLEDAASEAEAEDIDQDDASAPDEEQTNVFAKNVKPSDYETSVAEKLQRIRAAVGRGGSSARDDTYVEDLPESETRSTPKAINPLAQRLAELAKRNSELMDADLQREIAPAAESTPLALTEEERQEDISEEIIEDEAEVTPLVLKTEVADDSADEEDLEDEVASDEVTPEAELEERDTEDDDEDGDGSAEDKDDAASDHAEDDDRADEEVVAAKQPERDNQPLLLTTRHRPITNAEDDDDDDFDLQEEVAKIEREIASRPGNELARHGLPRSVEDAMSRIMTKTDLQLDLQETRDGRDAIAQLKAAVAATEAARQLGDNDAQSRDVSAIFRDDLGALEGTGNSDGTALPPLKLVQPVRSKEPTDGPSSSLRDVAPLNEAAERLRGIAATSKARSKEAEVLTFAEFAKQHGATDLVDKLEAAAAYLAFVEGENDFSRPQVMKVVQSATEAEVTREDGLRCFGRLLRQSRIVKLHNGRFQIPENTRFRPSGNRAAQG